VALLVGLALGAELLGTATGWPFGPYAYGELLGYRIAGLVPWVIPLSWFTMTYAALALALRSWWGPVGTAAWTAWGLVAWDLLMDPAMSRALPFWSWGVEGIYFGTPLSNLGGWLLVGTVLGGVAVVVSRPGAMVLRRQRLPLLLYLLNGLFPLTLAALEGMWTAALVGAAAMGLFLWLVLGGLPQRLHALRDRVFASPAFQRWAGAVPFTRPVAVARSRRVFELTTGFVFTQTVLACFRLGVFERLRGGPVELEVLASDWGLEPDAARRLLEAAEVLELVERRGWTRFGLGRLGAPLVGNAPVRAMMEHNLLLYDDLRNPVELLAKGGGPDTHLGRYWPYAGSRRPQDLDAEEVAGYSTLMTRSHGLVSAEVLGRYPFKRHRRVLDVGGGEGGFAGALAAAVPSVEVTLFDLPAVAARAEARLNGEGPGGGGGVTVVGGDFFRDPLPDGRDLVTLLRIVHDHDDEEVVHLLRRVHEALVPGGTVLVAEPMADVPGAESVGAAYFSWYLFAMGTGRPRSPGEIEALLRRAGFRGIRPVPSRVPVQTGMLVARRR
jgi:demethylspheroidene O-methyltransferase